MYTLLSLRMGLSMLWLYQEVVGEGFFGVDYGSKAFDLLTLVVSSNYVSLKCLQEKKKNKNCVGAPQSQYKYCLLTDILCLVILDSLSSEKAREEAECL